MVYNKVGEFKLLGRSLVVVIMYKVWRRAKLGMLFQCAFYKSLDWLYARNCRFYSMIDD